MRDPASFDQSHELSDRVSFGRSTAEAAEAAVMTVELNVKWRKGVTRTELRGIVAESCENFLLDLDGAADEVFATENEAHL